MTSRQKILKKTLLQALERYPNFLDQRLLSGFQKLVANSSSDFLTERPIAHLKRLLAIQFSLQRKIEKLLSTDSKESTGFFFKLFPRNEVYTSIAFVQSCPPEDECLSLSQIVRELELCIPSMKKIEKSFYTWWHPELGYRFFYFEIQKTRGKPLSYKSMRELEKDFRKKLYYMASKPTLFFPYNAEEAFKHLLVLHKEISNLKDLPQASIHFQTKNATSLEFMIYLVCTKQKSFCLENSKRLPSNVQTLFYLKKCKNGMASIIFSIQIPLAQFLENSTINLMNARRTVCCYLEKLCGPFRDYNGGLFGVQHDHFSKIKRSLSEKIPFFEFFAEKLFYAIKPIETQLILTVEIFEKLFSMFSHLLEKQQEDSLCEKNIKIFKLKKPSDRLNQQQAFSWAHLEIFGFYYYCFINQIERKKITTKKTVVKSVRLHFLEGPPVSLNPWCIYHEIRGRFLSKSLFEGLTRINPQGKLKLAGAESVEKIGGGVIYVFKMRENYWSNGERVTAFHYERSWKKALISREVSSEPFFTLRNARKIVFKENTVESLGVKTLDDKTLQVMLEYPDPFFLEKISHPLFFPALSPSQEPRFFNGPFTLLKREANELILERNPYYWDNKNIFLDQLKIEWGKTAEEIYSAFMNKTLDWIGTPFSRFTTEQLRALRERGFLKEKIVARTLCIYFNTQKKLFSLPKIRHLFHAALERNEIKKNIFPDDLPLQKMLPFHEDSFFCFKTQPPDISKIKEIFNSILKKERINKNNLSPIHLSYYSSPGHTQLSLYLKERWENIFNIPILLQPLAWNDLCTHLMRKNFHIAECTESAFSRDPLQILQRFEYSHSSDNPASWFDEEFQAKLESVRENSHLTRRRKLLHEAEKCLYRGLPFIPVVNRKFLYATSSNLKDYVIDETGDIDFRWAKIQG